MDLDAVEGVVAGIGSSDSAVRHQMAFAWASEQAPCRAGSSTFRRPVVAAVGVPHRLGKRARTPRGSHLEWVLLDSFIRHLSVENSSRTALTYGFTSAGDLLGVGFRAAPPPPPCDVPSRLQLVSWWEEEEEEGTSVRIPRRRAEGFSLWSPDAAKAVAAHKDSILLRFLLPGKSGISEEFFVYKSGPMALKSLGRCGHAFINCNAENNVGILRRVEGDEFAVAHLTVTPRQGGGESILWSSCPVTADLCYMLSKDGSWRTKCLPIHHGEGRGEDLVWWETDAVIAFGDFICWVDYLRGVLLCDIFSPNPELRYVPLPVTPYEGARHPELGDRGGVFAYRSVCVTQNGVRFVDAAAGNLWFSSAPSDITSWTLSSDNLTWVEDGRIALHKFYVLTRYLGLPQLLPRFPIVDINCPQIVYFALRGETCSGTLLVPVDMVSKMIGRPTAYALRSSLSSDEDDNFTTSCNLFYNEPFLACEFSKFMGPDVLLCTRNGTPVEGC